MAEARYTITAKDKTKAALKSVRGSLNRVSKAVFSLKGALAGAVGVAGFGALVKSSLASVDALAKTSQKLGLTTEALAGLQHAAELSGVSTNTMNMALQRMVRRLAEAAQGTGEAKKAVKELGLDAKQLAALSPEQAFLKITKAMEGVGSQSDRVRLAMRFFDSEGVALVNTMNLGADGLKKAAEEAKAFGVAVSAVDAKKIEEANDSMTRIKRVVEGVGNSITIALAPYIKLIADRFTDAAKGSNGFADTANAAIKRVISAIGTVLDAINYINIAWTTVKLGAVGLFDFIIQGLAKIGISINGFLDKIPGVGKLFDEQGLTITAEASRMAVDDVAASLQNLLNAPNPSETLLETFAQVEQLSTEHAEKLVAIEQDKVTRIAKLNTAGGEKDVKISKTLQKKKKKAVLGELASLTQGVAQSNRTMFNINKTAGIANALVSTYEGVSKTMGAYPYPINIGMAAASLVAGLAQVNAIKSTSFGGGGSAPSLAGSGGGGATVNTIPLDTPKPVAEQTKKIEIDIRGSDDEQVSVGWVREKLLPSIKDALDDGYAL